MSVPHAKIGQMSTHIAAEAGDIADTVLLPGDPLRAQWIAETYLSEVRTYSTVRNMLGFTGTYAGQRISVQGSGMGQPSLSIYATELIQDYGVQRLIRVGSCGAIAPSVQVHDLVLAVTAGTDSSMNRLRFHGLDYAPAADFPLLRSAYDLAAGRSLPVHTGQVFASDSFYHDRPDLMELIGQYGVLAIEMETNALYTLAAKHGRRALTILTVSDHIPTGVELPASERERGFDAMARVALDTVVADAGASRP